jgi:hypothetical protein
MRPQDNVSQRLRRLPADQPWKKPRRYGSITPWKHEETSTFQSYNNGGRLLPQSSSRNGNHFREKSRTRNQRPDNSFTVNFNNEFVPQNSCITYYSGNVLSMLVVIINFKNVEQADCPTMVQTDWSKISRSKSRQIARELDQRNVFVFWLCLLALPERWDRREISPQRLVKLPAQKPQEEPRREYSG